MLVAGRPGREPAQRCRGGASRCGRELFDRQQERSHAAQSPFANAFDFQQRRVARKGPMHVTIGDDPFGCGFADPGQDGEFRPVRPVDVNQERDGVRFGFFEFHELSSVSAKEKPLRQQQQQAKR